MTHFPVLVVMVMVMFSLSVFSYIRGIDQHMHSFFLVKQPNLFLLIFESIWRIFAVSWLRTGYSFIHDNNCEEVESTNAQNK
jgi:hypothetical protein